MLTLRRIDAELVSEAAARGSELSGAAMAAYALAAWSGQGRRNVSGLGQL